MIALAHLEQANNGRFFTANCMVGAAPDLLAACKAFVEAYEKSLQLVKTDITLRMAKQAIEKAQGNYLTSPHRKMNKMIIRWEQTKSNAWKGSDDDDNTYSMPASQETCTVRTPDGYEGFGWTPKEALDNVEKLLKMIPASPEV